jgi:hypothetical protein
MSLVGTTTQFNFEFTDKSIKYITFFVAILES